MKSNAIVYAKDGATVGIGAGQPNRVDSARIAAWKSEAAAKAAGLDAPLTRGSVVASDAFFPVRRRAGGGGGGRRDGGDPARRIDARRGGDRRGGCRRRRDGVHRHASLPALTAMSSLPLSGVRVLDLTRVLSGPFCTMLLGDLGADVIKVETPGEGDTVRHQGASRDGLSWYFANYNRNKRSITLNLRSR